MKATLLAVTILVFVGFGIARSYANIVLTGPFAGTMTETWESFPNYSTPGEQYLNSSTTIMGGNASIAGSIMEIYQPTVAPWGLSISGLAQVSDGVKGLGLGTTNNSAVITWAAPISTFGGYFAAPTGAGYPDPATITVSFFDTVSTLIGTETFSYSTSTNPNGADGHLEWHGWTSSEPIGSISITGDYIAMDGLQATLVPEPSTFALAGLSVAALVILRCRNPIRINERKWGDR